MLFVQKVTKEAGEPGEHICYVLLKEINGLERN